MSHKDNPNVETEDLTSIGVKTGLPFLEKLLLAIINAHDVGTKTKRQRLNAAMIALAGEKASKNPLPDDLDQKALEFMGREHHRDKVFHTDHRIKHYRDTASPPPPEIRSDRSLAIAAVEQFYSARFSEEEKHTTMNRLREKFGGTYQRKSGTGKGVNFRRTHEYLAVEHGYEAESMEAQGLEMICDELRNYGVKTVIKS